MARHLGLEQLAALAEAGRAFLGPVKAGKFVVDAERGDSVLVSSAPRLLDSLELGATGRLLAEAVRAQHAAHGAATGTLLLLAGAWSRAALECLRAGVPVPALAALMSDGLRACLDAADALRLPVLLACRHRRALRREVPARAPRLTPIPIPIQVPIQTPIQTPVQTQVQSPVQTPLQTQVQTPTPTPSGPPPRSAALAHSRHFRSTARCPEQGCHDLAELAGGLSHGDPGSMKLAGTALWLLQRAEGPQAAGCPGPPTFDLARVFACRLPGLPEAASCVCPGYATVLPTGRAALVSSLHGLSARVVLLDGDLTETYRHPGLQAPANVRTVLDCVPDSDGPEDAWATRVLAVLTGLRVHVVLVRGRVSSVLREACARAGQLVLGAVPAGALQALAEASGAEPAAYVWQLSERSVGTGMRAGLLGGLDSAGARGVAMAVAVDGARLVTAVLTCPAAAHLQAREDRFWASARRLQQALGERSVFPGGGAVELLCLSQLQALAGRPPETLGPARRRPPGLALHAPVVLDGLARGWHSFLAAVLSKCAPYPSEQEAAARVQQLLQAAASSGAPAAYILREFRGPPGTGTRVLDVVTPKLEAWRRALDLVLLVLQTDAEVVAGQAHTRVAQGGQTQLLL